MKVVHEYPVLIRELHLDTFGHMNNATYLQIFEDARWDLITKNGYGLRRVQELQLGPIILGVNIQFQRELRLREMIQVRTFVPTVDGKKMTIRQVMMNAKGEEACIAEFLFGLFDMKARKLVEATPEWRHAVGLA